MISITVIVPVYKVEKELPRCIESVLAQEAYISELLLIDDGSPDSCGSICDKYAQNNAVIRVIHQDNKGRAAVRNIGIRESKSEFVTFVDSDDYILDGLYKKAQETIDKLNPDIITFGYQDYYEGAPLQKNRKIGSKDSTIILSAEDAIDQLFFKNRVDIINCNKIIRKELFNGVSFPKEYIYEDIFTTYKYVSKATKIVCLQEPYYVYCHRAESISSKEFTDEGRCLITAIEEIYSFGKRFCSTDKNLSVGYAYWLVVIANMMIRSNYKDDEYFLKARSFTRKVLLRVMTNGILDFPRKIEIGLFAVVPDFYKLIYRIYLTLFR